jgi:phage terminase large subunit-like protein
VDYLVVMLDDLAALRDRLAALAQTHTQARQAALPALVRTRLARLDAAYAPQIEALEAQVAEVSGSIKQAVLERGESVKGTQLHAIWAKGRVSWDSRYLEIYAAAHPEIAPARKEGQPSVSIREVR